MDKELRNKISENKILTYNERARIISDLESYEDIRAKFGKTIEEIENEIKFWNEESTDPKPYTAEIRKAKANSYRHALEIIKQNIGGL